jgi:DNA repair protein RecO (recombination protein O)
MGLYHDQGVVLRTYRLGEADRIVVLLTAGRGKVRAVAKGVRRTTSRFGGRMEPLSHLKLLCYEGRELDIVSQADTIDHWRRFHDDLEGLTDGLALAEAAEQVAQEGQPSAALYRMLVGALRTLAERPAPLVVAGFYLKLLSLDGAEPVVDRCAACGTLDGEDQGAGSLVAFDFAQGGTLCRNCRSGMPITQGGIAVLRQMLGGDLRRALEVQRGPLAEEISDLATRALETHLERRLRAVRAFDAYQRH